MIKHGLYGTRIYRIWQGMKWRCANPNAHGYELYGARDIKVCDEWREDVAAFWKWAQENGYEDNLTIDRIDVNGDYCPENCRWATHKEQTNNKRNNYFISYKGETKTLAQWVEVLNLCKTTTEDRLRRGWAIEDAFERPKRGSGHKAKYCGKEHHAYKNGYSHTSIYKVWKRLKKQKNVCDAWIADFMNFYRDMGDLPAGYKLVRINPQRSYSKENCKWVPAKDVPRYTSIKIRLGKLGQINTFCKLVGINISVSIDESVTSSIVAEQFKYFGAQIKRMREIQSITQQQFSVMAGLGKTIISQIEAGCATLSMEKYIIALKAVAIICCGIRDLPQEAKNYFSDS